MEEGAGWRWVARGGSAEAGGGSRSPGRICELSEPASAEGEGFPGPARPERRLSAAGSQRRRLSRE